MQFKFFCLVLCVCQLIFANSHQDDLHDFLFDIYTGGINSRSATQTKPTVHFNASRIWNFMNLQLFLE